MITRLRCAAMVSLLALSPSACDESAGGAGGPDAGGDGSRSDGDAGGRGPDQAELAGGDAGTGDRGRASGFPTRPCGTLGLGAISALAFSRDGQLVAGATRAGVVKVLRVADGAEVLQLAPQPLTVTSVAFSPDGSSLTAATSSAAYQWRIADGVEMAVRRARAGASILAVWHSREGEPLALEARPGALESISLRDGSSARRYQTSADLDLSAAVSAALSADGSVVAVLVPSSSGSPSLSVWAGQDVPGQVSGNWRADAPGASTVAVSADGRYVAAGEWMLQANDGVPVVSRTSHDILALSPDGGLAIAKHRERSYEIRIFPLRGGTANLVEPSTQLAAFSPNGDSVLVGTWTELELVRVSDPMRPRRLGPRDPRALSIGFSPDARTLVAASRGYSNPPFSWSLTFWDVPRLSFLVGGPGAFPVTVSPRSAVAAVGADGGLGTVKLWDLNRHEELSTIGSDGDRPAFFSADGQLIAAVNDSIVTFWRVADGARVERFAIEVEGYVYFSPSYGLALSPDGSTIAGRVTHDRVSLISTTSKREIGRLALPPDPGLKVATAPPSFSPSGALLAVGGVGVYSVADGSLLFRFDGPTERALFSPVDDLLAVAEPDGIALYRLGATPPEKERIPMVRERSGYLSPYSYSPDAIAFSADGAVLATSDAGGVRLWCWR